MREDLRKLIQSDLRRYGHNNEREMSFMERRELYGYHYTKAMRMCKYYREHGMRFRFYICRLKLSRLSLKYGFQINYSTDIGKGLYLGHAGNIIVNYMAHIGKNVNLAQGVTIGLSNGGKCPGVPTIGDNVWIGANSVVVGGIKVGNDVMIAPNTFVNFDVPDHSLVISQKATILSRNPATEEYIENRVE